MCTLLHVYHIHIYAYIYSQCAIKGELWWSAMRIMEKEVLSEIFNQLSLIESKIIYLFYVSKDLQF
jgi:hypothetical protein